MKKLNYKKGFIGKLILILVAIFLIASYFNIDIKSVVESPATQKNWSYVSAIGKTVWKGYLEKPTQYLWNNILSGFIKDSFAQSLKNLKAIKDGEFKNVNLFPQLPDGFIPTMPGTQDSTPN